MGAARRPTLAAFLSLALLPACRVCPPESYSCRACPLVVTALACRVGVSPLSLFFPLFFDVVAFSPPNPTLPLQHSLFILSLTTHGSDCCNGDCRRCVYDCATHAGLPRCLSLACGDFDMACLCEHRLTPSLTATATPLFYNASLFVFPFHTQYRASGREKKS